MSLVDASSNLDRPRLLHLVTQMTIGGATLTALEAALGMSERFGVHIASGPTELIEHDVLSRVHEAALPIHIVPSLTREIRLVDDARAVRQTRALLRAIEPDILHTHSSKAGVVGRFAAWGLPVKTLHSIHGWGHTPDDKVLRRVALIAAERFVGRAGDLLGAVSTDVRAEGLRLGIGDEASYRLLPEWVDFTPVNRSFANARSEARAKLAIDPYTEVIGWVGRFNAQKDPDTLAAAIGHALRSRPGAIAVLIGEGDSRGRVEGTVRNSGLSDRVRFVGARGDARSLYAAFDVLLHTSRWEGHPRVLQEAIAERVPVVATRCAGVASIVCHPAVGAVVEPGDYIAAARHCIAYLEHRDRHVPLSDEAVRVVASKNGAEASLAAHLAVYEELLGRPV